MHIVFIMMTCIILVMSSYGGNKVVGWGEGLPEGTQVPTLRPILNVSDNLAHSWKCTNIVFEINDEYECVESYNVHNHYRVYDLQGTLPRRN